MNRQRMRSTARKSISSPKHAIRGLNACARRRRHLILALAILSAWPALSHAANYLSDIRPATNGWMRVAGHMATNQAVQLESSPDLKSWEGLALLDFRQPKPDAYNEWWATNDTFAFLDLAAPTQQRRFYRFCTAPFQ